jgi:DNA ligase-1
MPDIEDGGQVSVQGSGSTPYVLRNTGGVYSCSCPAWRNQSVAIEKRTCKHLRKVRGDEAENQRVGNAVGPAKLASKSTAQTEGPGLLLAHPWENDLDLTGWWMSEKLDGVRAYWDGKRFWSRLGNEFMAPEWFTAALPDSPLDGELWGGRKRFQRTVSIVRRQDRSEGWKELGFVVFDAPRLEAAFEDRLEHCRDILEKSGSKYARYHPHELCNGTAHLRQELARVEALGGEGLMMRKPGSRYEIGRSSTLLKVKSFKDDEACVIGHIAGAGRHLGRLGALEVQMKNGVRFSVGTGFSDKERESPPPIGSTITFRYQELSDVGVPRFPSYVGERIDAPPVVAKPAAKPAPKVAHEPKPSEEEKPMPNLIEEAKSGRAACRTCRQKIDKGQLRFGEETPNAFSSDGGSSYFWHHLMCAAKKKPALLKEALASYSGEIPNRDELEKQLASGKGGGGDDKPPFPYAEKAPTSRSKCISCDETIEKGTWRVAIEREVDTGTFTTKGAGYLHPGCAVEHVEEDDLSAKVLANSKGLAPEEADELRAQLL